METAKSVPFLILLRREGKSEYSFHLENKMLKPRLKKHRGREISEELLRIRKQTVHTLQAHIHVHTAVQYTSAVSAGPAPAPDKCTCAPCCVPASLAPDMHRNAVTIEAAAPCHRLSMHPLPMRSCGLKVGASRPGNYGIQRKHAHMHHSVNTQSERRRRHISNFAAH